MASPGQSGPVVVIAAVVIVVVVVVVFLVVVVVVVVVVVAAVVVVVVAVVVVVVVVVVIVAVVDVTVTSPTLAAEVSCELQIILAGINEAKLHDTTHVLGIVYYAAVLMCSCVALA